MAKLRILQAPIVALYGPQLYVKGLRELGHQADYMTFQTSGNEWLMQGEPDYNLNGNMLDITIEKTREVEFFLYAIERYDIIHIHSNYSLFNGSYSLWDYSSDIKFLHDIGKKIVCSHWGWCDTFMGDVARSGGRSECDVCESLRPILCENKQVTNRIRNTFRYADAITSNASSAVDYEKVIWMNNAIDCNEWRPFLPEEIPERYRLPKTKNIRIYHSFGNSGVREDVKGTKHIKAAVERLQAEGYPVEFMFHDRVPNTELKYYQAQADLVIDQLYCGWHGSTAVECMAIGKPVVTYINPEIGKIAPPDHPLIHASVETIYDVIKELIGERERLAEIGRLSRNYALKYHHYTVVAKRLEEIYYSL